MITRVRRRTLEQALRGGATSPGGIYFARLTTADGSAVCKVLLAR